MTAEKASLYVVEFDQGTVKIGYSTDPDARIKSVMYQGAVFRHKIIRHWISEPHTGAYLNEKTLIEWCAVRASEVNGKEWFVGLEFDEVKKTILQLIEADGFLPT